MKEYEGLINYLTNIILRPHRETYGVEKLGPSKIVVKSHEKSISMLESMSKNEKHLPKQMQQNYCELIEVNRKQVTIKREGKNIQLSIYEPQLTSLQNINTEYQKIPNQGTNKNVKLGNMQHKKSFHESKYENCVIFLHANSGSRLEGTQYAKHVLKYRTLCVSFDYTGSGISEGQYTTMGVNQSKDLSSVINYIAETYKVKYFSLWGRSMGAVTGIYYLLTKYKEDVAKIRVTSCVIDSPFSHLEQLIKEIASKKSSLPQFIFQPILKIIENDIINKVGVNIFTQLNIIQKIRNLTNNETKLINSVSFLGLASKDDTMISHQHCQDLCTLLISEDVRRSDLIDDKNYLVNNSYDKHLMMLVGFKKQINTKGDFIEIQGDHNKPRSNEVKQKVSFFIQDNFYSFKDFQLPQQSPVISKEPQNTISFSKTGVSIKTKLSFAKTGLIKPRKDSNTNSQLMNNQQNRKQESFPRHNYNLINLKQIKAKQSKQSLSKQKQSIRNSLNKNFLFRQKKDQKQGFQTTKSIESGKGLNIVSKQFHRERINPDEQNSKMTKKAYETLQNSKHFSTQIQPQRKKIFQNDSHFSSFLAKLKEEKTSNNQNMKKISDADKSPNNSDLSGSVNNSIKRQKQNQVEQNREKVVVSPLQFSDNLPIMNGGQNLTQRPVRTERIFESLPSQRVKRNNMTQPDVNQNVLNQSPVVNTSPFNLSIQRSKMNASQNVRESMEDPFRKKDTSEIMQESELMMRKEGPKTPQVKLSISQFRNRQQEGVRSVNKRIQQYALQRKQTNSVLMNTGTNWTQQSSTISMLQSTQSMCSQDKASTQKSIQFRKRETGETNSIHCSDVSYEDSFDQLRWENGKNPGRNYLQGGRRQERNSKNANNNNMMGNYQPNINSNNNMNQKIPIISSVSNSLSIQTNNQVSLKQMMINNGHKGMTQSSTFNPSQSYSNAFYQSGMYNNNSNQFNDSKLFNANSNSNSISNNNNNNSSYQYNVTGNSQSGNYQYQQYQQQQQQIRQQQQQQIRQQGFINHDKTSVGYSINNNNINNNNNVSYYHINNQSNKNAYLATVKSMKTSQYPNGQTLYKHKQYHNKITMSAIQTNSSQQQNQSNNYTNNYQNQNQLISNQYQNQQNYNQNQYQNQQNTSYSNNPNFWYVPQQGVKQSIQYKKKINKLID